MEFLVEIEVSLPTNFSPQERDALITEERKRGRELATAGIIRAIWRVPGQFANRAIWSVRDATELHAAIVSLPLWPYAQVEVTALAQHDLASDCRGIPERLTIA